MKPFEEQFSAWVDGQLSDAELKDFEKQLATHPEAAAGPHDAEYLFDQFIDLMAGGR